MLWASSQLSRLRLHFSTNKPVFGNEMKVGSEPLLRLFLLWLKHSFRLSPCCSPQCFRNKLPPVILAADKSDRFDESQVWRLPKSIRYSALDVVHPQKKWVTAVTNIWLLIMLNQAEVHQSERARRKCGLILQRCSDLDGEERFLFLWSSLPLNAWKDSLNGV